ncbi:hypothetical protein FB107DRAFT_286036 [Schizophyllum commune]
MHRAGYHPSFQEADSILERLRDFEAAEPRMIDELRRLEARTAHARRRAALGKALLSPWRRIPPEIWSEIFILSVPENWYRIPIDRKFLACAEVCYSWRVVALNTSELWTDIIIGLNTGLPRPNLEALFMTHLGRAGNQLLRLRAQDIGMPWAEPYYNSLLWQLIGQQSRRWKTIELLDVHPLAYAKLNGLSYTNLRSLLLRMGDEDTAMTQVHAFDDTPELRSLEIRDTVDFELSLSWRLHTLEIAYVPPAHGHALNKPFLGSILPCSQTLRKLVLDAEIVGDRAPVHPTIFPSLEELELTDGASIQTTGIIRVLQRLPRLTRLEVEDSDWTDLIELGDVIELAAAPHAPDAEVRLHDEHAFSSHYWTRRAVEVSC